MRTDDRILADGALATARLSAYPDGEFVGQESFMDASQVLRLVAAAGIGPGTRVVDVCCGVAGPGRLLVATTGCDYLGVDVSATALDVARSRAGGRPRTRFVQADVPPVPAGPFDVVLILETVLAFEDKPALLDALAAALVPGGRLAMTVEVGDPLSSEERRVMPAADTVWPWPHDELVAQLAARGFVLHHCEDLTAAHRLRAESLLDAFLEHREQLAADLGAAAVAALCDAHRTWVTWLGRGRVRKLALVAELSA